MDAMYEQQTVRVDDLATDPRWPELGRRVTSELGVASVLCFQLFVHAHDLGSLNLLARRPNAFTDESERIGLLFASHAAIALADAQDLENVSTALNRRDAISQAKGILMERYKITAPVAFALLATTSQETNTRVYDVAEVLTQTGLLGSGPSVVVQRSAQGVRRSTLLWVAVLHDPLSSWSSGTRYPSQRNPGQPPI